MTSLRQSGWTIIDNTGDGNCGYYSLVFGLENTGNTECSINTSDAGPPIMLANMAWQSRIVDLRRRLLVHSQRLLRTIYNESNRKHEWWWRMEASSDEEMELGADQGIECFSFGFWDSAMHQKDYFSDLDTAFHMKPYWGCLVFASLFRMRVILIIESIGSTYNAEADKIQETHSWSTVIFEYNSPTDTEEKPHITSTIHEELIVRIPDVEFRRMPTIELLFRNGYDPNGDAIPQHFLCFDGSFVILSKYLLLLHLVLL